MNNNCKQQTFKEYVKRKKYRRNRRIKFLLFALIFVLISGFLVCIYLYYSANILSSGKNLNNTVTSYRDDVSKEDSSKSGIVDSVDGGKIKEDKVHEGNMKSKDEDDIKDFSENTKYTIHIYKRSFRLDVYEKNIESPIKTFKCAVAKNEGDKKKAGDNTTPTSWGNVEEIPSNYKNARPGVSSDVVPFRIEKIYNSEDWSHDFNDGNGVIEHAYGPWFISIDTGWDGIGIHGTHDPKSIGTKASEGCIRLKNEDIVELKEIIEKDNDGIGTKVIITED